MAGRLVLQMQILVLEASTTSAKAMLYDSTGRQTAVLAEAYPPQGTDPTVHDADTVVAAVTRLARRLSKGRTVAVVALVGAWHGLLLADRSMQPLTPVYLWSNTEPAPSCRFLRRNDRMVEWFYRTTGCMVHSTYPVFMLPLLKERGVRLEETVILDEGSYLNWLLTGELVQTQCLASGSGLLNMHSKSYDPDVLAWAGASEDQLPALVPSHVSYPLSARGAALLGVPKGTPVLPTIADGASNQVGSGALKRGVMTLSVGTSGAIRLPTDAPRLPCTPSTWCYVSTHGWLSGAATSGACNCIDWFRENLSWGNPSHRDLEGRVFDGREPIFLPFLHGERCPGWDDGRLGEFMGLSASDDITALYRSIQEGVLFNLLQCYQALVELNGPPDRLKVSGGILNSRRWTQMCADILGVALERNAALHASLMGGAILGMELAGELSTARDYESPASGIVTPDPRAVDRHRRRYHAYLAAYHSEQRLG